MSNLAYGTFTITNLSVVTSVDVYYYNSTSSTSLVGGEWSTNTPTWTNGKYIWSKTITTWEQGVTTQSQPVCITGQKGSTGSAGQSVTKITQQYALGTSNQTAPTTGWSNTMPTFQTGKYYWTRSEIVWANPTSTTYTTAVLANGITSANTTAATANSNAQSAVSTANSANQTANTANQTAQNAVSIANGKNTIYYSSSKPTGGTYKAGDTWFNLTTDGYKLYEYDTTANDWVQKSMDGKSITAGTITAAEIQAGAITSGKLATDSIQSRNYVAGTGGIYSADGTFLDLTNGNIYSPNFGINNTIDNIDNGAYIRGSVYASDGTIGSDANNYWYIGNYYDYNQGQSAMLRSHGTAAIQLGDSNTWRVATNRIHTAWNDDSTSGEAFRLHYPSYGGKYWDSGLHVPTSATDKLLYIRNASTSTSLENLQNDINDTSGGHQWNYQFYLTSNGSLYAKNIYIIDDSGNTTQIGGTDGVYLLKSGGTITGDLQVNQAIKNSSGSAITLQTNLGSTTAGTLTGNSTNPINIGVTGTLPVANGGTGNVNYTSGGVVYVSNTNPKTLLSNAAGTSGHLLASGGSGAPTWVNPGTLTVAAATKATQDGDGNVIKTTYLKLSGGNVTGPVSFGDSVSIDDLKAGTLVVTGNASFVNNINVDSINGVQVGETPKFTDTVTTVSTTGTGNAITSISASNGAITATKGTTFLTGITSSQVTTALGYTPYNATNPNGYTSNTGTVTSVAASGSGGITISGSPITTSGTLTIGLNLSTAINGLGEGTSPANRDDYAVVQYAGGGTTTTTYHRRKLSNIFKALIADDIPGLAWSKITSGNDDLKAIEALEGTSGLLKKTAANTWTLDTSAYVTSSGVTSITLTQGTGISIGSSGTAITSTGTRTIALADNYGDTKNPYASKTARYVLAAPAAAAGVPTFRALTNADVGLSNVLNIKQVTGIGQGDNGKIRVFKGSGTNDYEDVAVEIVATSTSSVASAQKLSSYGGSATQPVYFPAEGANAGKPVAVTYKLEQDVLTTSKLTDTWNKVSTTQDGYVTKLPGNTTTFLRGDGTWGTPVGTTYTFDGTYNASSNKAATVSTVTNAINALDGNLNSTAPGAGKTLTAFSQTDGKVSATFGDISITKSQISDFPSTLTPAAHTHGNIQNGGTLQTNDITIGSGDKLVVTDYSDSNKIARASISFDGSTATKALTQKGTWETFNNYSLPLAANGTRGGVQIGYSSSGKNYAVQLSSEKMYVNVPWTDTTYSAGTGLSLSENTFSNTGVIGVKGDSESSYRTGQVNITKANIGLSNVENTALSTWTGTNKITTLGTITTGTWNGTTIAVANGGTGKTTGKDAANYFLNSLDVGTSTPVDADYYISQYVSGGTTTTTYHRRPMSALWNYIKGKGDSAYVTIGTTQTILGRKTFENLAAVTFKPSSGTDKCNINYNATLGALVFSF